MNRFTALQQPSLYRIPGDGVETTLEQDKSKLNIARVITDIIIFFMNQTN